MNFSGEKEDSSDIEEIQVKSPVTPMFLQYAKQANWTKLRTVLMQSRSRKNTDLINLEDEDKRTALHYSAKDGLDELVARLLFHESNIDIVDNFGFTPLHLAVLGNHRTTAMLLVQGGADTSLPSTNPECYGYSSLHLACSYSRTESLISDFLSLGIDPNIQNNDGNSPLHLCCCFGFSSLARVLLKYSYSTNYYSVSPPGSNYKVNLKIKNKLGISPWMSACANGQLKLVIMLEKLIREETSYSICDLDEQDYNGNTALHHTIMRDFTLHAREILKSITSGPLTPSTYTSYCQTKSNNKLKEFDEIAYIVTRLGASLTILNKDQNTPLMLEKNDSFRALLEFASEYRLFIPKKLSVLLLKVKRYEADLRSPNLSTYSGCSSSDESNFSLSSSLEPTQLQNLVEKVEDYIATFNYFQATGRVAPKRSFSVDVRSEGLEKPAFRRVQTMRAGFGNFEAPVRLRKQAVALQDNLLQFSEEKKAKGNIEEVEERSNTKLIPIPCRKTDNKEAKRRRDTRAKMLLKKELEVEEATKAKIVDKVEERPLTKNLNHNIKKGMPSIKIETEPDNVVIELKGLMRNPYFWLYIVALFIAIYFGVENMG